MFKANCIFYYITMSSLTCICRKGWTAPLSSISGNVKIRWSIHKVLVGGPILDLIVCYLWDNPARFVSYQITDLVLDCPETRRDPSSIEDLKRHSLLIAPEDQTSQLAR